MSARHPLPLLLVLGALAGTPAISNAVIESFIARQTPFLVGGIIDGAEFHAGTPDYVWIDLDGNGLDAGASERFGVPTGITSAWDLKLSPTRGTMRAVLTSGGTATIRFFHVPLASSQPLAELGSQATLPAPIANSGFFEFPGAIPTAYLVGARDAGNANKQKIVWWNLETGVNATDAFGFEPDVESNLTFARDGRAAWLKYDLMGTPADYALVNLCPGHLGERTVPGFQNESGTRNAYLQIGTGGVEVVNIRSGDSTATVVHTITAPICSSGPAPTGACCLLGGGCRDGSTAADCAASNGAYKGDGSVCASAGCAPPPAPQLYVTGAGPANANTGSNATYTFTYGNSGSLAAGAVTVSATIPSTAVYVSSTGGGIYSAITRAVTWTIGTLAPGASGQVAFTVTAPCFGTSMSVFTYSITGTPGGTVAGSPVIVTPLVTLPVTPLTPTLGGIAQAALPLHAGDHVQYTLTLVNTLNVIRPDLRFSFSAGDNVQVDSIVSVSHGTVTNGGSNLLWAGSIGPLETFTLVFRVAVRECRPPGPSTTSLNRGFTFVVYTNCNGLAATITPSQTFTIAPPPVALDLRTPTLGPAQSALGALWAVARPGATVDVELVAQNLDAAPSPPAAMQMTLPASVTPAGNPPFVGSPPAGTTWDAGTRTVSWNGTIPGSSSVVVRIQVTLDPTACVTAFDLTGSYGSCTGYLDKQLSIMGVPAPPADAYAVLLDPTHGLSTFRPGVDPGRVPLLCFDGEFMPGLARAADGTLWISGTPTIRFNPGTLDFEIMPADFMTSLGLSTLDDVAVDPLDSTLVFIGYRAAFGFGIRRWDPDTRSVTWSWNEPSPATIYQGTQVVIDPERRIAVAANNTVLQFTPGATPVLRTLTDGVNPNTTFFTGMCLDTDGDYLAIRYTTPGTGPKPMMKVDRVTGAFTPVHDLDAVLPGVLQINAIGVTPDLSVLFGPSQGSLGLLRRQPAEVGTAFPTIPAGLADLVWVGGPTTADVAPGSAAAPGAVRLLPARPNPARDGATLSFELPREARVRLQVFDLGGRVVRTLADGVLAGGPHEARWDARDAGGRRVAPGLYLVRLRTAGYERSVKLMLMP